MLHALLVALLGTAPGPAPAAPGPTSATAGAARTAPASSPTVELVPPRARPGDAFLVRARGAPAGASAEVAGRTVPLYPRAGALEGVAGLPVETPAGPLAVRVTAPGGEPVEARLEVLPATFPRRELQVDRQFVEPPSPALQQRIDEDRAAFARAFAQPAAAPLFGAPFAWPRRARVTAGYGERRTINGVKPSQHYGLDLSGKEGAPVAASNAGRVVLVRDCWASGRTVIVWHGAGLFTTYFHLSRADVTEGEAVKRGQRLGAVGRTGRVSGPHLHWGVKVGDLYVDPRSVLRLPFG